MTELDEITHEQVKSLCSDGDKLLDQNEPAAAIDRYRIAFSLLPEPVNQWDAAKWILAALGDAYFQAGQFTDARDALQEAMHCPGAIGNPFLHLRLGQAQFELKNLPRAKDELARALLLDTSVFEDEDPKYLTYIRRYIKE